MKTSSVKLSELLCLFLIVVFSGCTQQEETVTIEPEKKPGRICVPERHHPVTQQEKTIMQMEVIAHSVQNRPIRKYVFNAGAGNPILIFGGFHGNERASVYVAQQLVDLLESDNALCCHREVVIVPNVNPDGRVANTRRNANKIDLNRNFPTKNFKVSNPNSYSYGGPKALCEPESKAVYKLVKSVQPNVIISIHSISGGRECNNYDGPARKLAEAMSKCNGLPPKASIGYPTPGSFGTWAGKELEIPTITLEIPRSQANKPAWKDNRESLLLAIREY